MTWIWATLLLILSAPFVLWPLIRGVPPAAERNDEEERDPDPPAAGG